MSKINMVLDTETGHFDGWLTGQELANRWFVSTQTIYYYIANNRIRKSDWVKITGSRNNGGYYLFRENIQKPIERNY